MQNRSSFRRAASLFVVLALAKLGLFTARVLEGGGRDLVSLWAPATFLYQGVWLSLGFWACDALAVRLSAQRGERGAWLAYAVLVTWTAINVPVARLFSTPLTLTLLEGAGGALIDSILLYATPANILAVLLLAAAALSVPRLLRQFEARAARMRLAPWLASLCAISLLGPLGARRMQTLGLHRDPAITLIASVLARLARPAPPAHVPLVVAESPVLDVAALRGRAQGRNVLWISLESTAAEYLAMYGARQDPTPQLSRLARDALVFDAAYTTYPGSMKALYAMLCSQYPAPFTPTHVYRHAPCTALPAALVSAGYKSALFHAGRLDYLDMIDVVDARGFQLLADADTIPARESLAFGIDEGSTVARLLQFVDSVPQGQPFFAMYLPIAGHHPYHWPSGKYAFGRATPRDLYLGDLQRGDEALGALFEGLRTRGKLEQTLIVVHGDHGEAFYQHPSNWAHPLFIFDENVRVPLLFLAPGLLHGQLRVPQPASLVDVAPTLLALLGLPVPQASEGRSLLEPGPHIARFFTDYGLPQVGLRDGPWKYILELESGRASLFDERVPGEQTDVSAQQPERADRYRAHLSAWWQTRAAAAQSWSPK